MLVCAGSHLSAPQHHRFRGCLIAIKSIARKPSPCRHGIYCQASAPPVQTYLVFDDFLLKTHSWDYSLRFYASLIKFRTSLKTGDPTSWWDLLDPNQIWELLHIMLSYLLWSAFIKFQSKIHISMQQILRLLQLNLWKARSHGTAAGDLLLIVTHQIINQHCFESNVNGTAVSSDRIAHSLINLWLRLAQSWGTV